MSNGRLGGSASIGGFFQQKMDEIKGVDQERSKQEKLKRVHEKISDVSSFCCCWRWINCVIAGSVYVTNRLFIVCNSSKMQWERVLISLRRSRKRRPRSLRSSSCKKPRTCASVCWTTVRAVSSSMRREQCYGTRSSLFWKASMSTMTEAEKGNLRPGRELALLWR